MRGKLPSYPIKLRDDRINLWLAEIHLNLRDLGTSDYHAYPIAIIMVL